MNAQIALLPDGKRLHLNHGPIDLVVEAFGAASERRRAYDQAAEAFAPLLGRLCDDLALIRSSRRDMQARVSCPVARRMVDAVSRHEGFVTPMAAVAGAVADHVLEAMTTGRRLLRAYVNNGGDCALYLAPGARFRIGAVAGDAFGRLEVAAPDPVRGVATSGWGGRSHSLGIADAVTVLGRTAAQADVAATLIANAVDLPGHPQIERMPASALSPDSDLRARQVTTAVPQLSVREIEEALGRGLARARHMLAKGHIHGAALTLQGQTRITHAERTYVHG